MKTFLYYSFKSYPREKKHSGVELNFVRLDMEENSDIKDQLDAFIQETN